MYQTNQVFNSGDGSLELHNAVEHLLMQLPDVHMKVTKTQASFSSNRGFAWTWPPVTSVRGRPDEYIVLSFALGRKLDSPRIEQALEVYHGRWMHHFILSESGQLDDELICWLKEAYEFASNRRI